MSTGTPDKDGSARSPEKTEAPASESGGVHKFSEKDARPDPSPRGGVPGGGK